MMKPDFRTWAENITTISRKYGTAQDEISRSLEQAFDQGYHLGLNKGWQHEFDRDITECELNKSLLDQHILEQVAEQTREKYEPPYERLSDSIYEYPYGTKEKNI